MNKFIRIILNILGIIIWVSGILIDVATHFNFDLISTDIGSGLIAIGLICNGIVEFINKSLK